VFSYFKSEANAICIYLILSLLPVFVRAGHFNNEQSHQTLDTNIEPLIQIQKKNIKLLNNVVFTDKYIQFNPSTFLFSVHQQQEVHEANVDKNIYYTIKQGYIAAKLN
jgi:hypothetical protein